MARSNEDQAIDPRRVIDDEPRRDPRTQRVAEDVRPRDPQRVEQGDAIGGEVADGVIGARRVALPGIAVVDRQGAVLPGEGRHLEFPAAPPPCSS